MYDTAEYASQVELSFIRMWLILIIADILVCNQLKGDLFFPYIL